MTALKERAISVLNNINTENRINYFEYSVLFDAINEIEIIKDRDREIKELWELFEDVPLNPITERIEVDFGIWKSGTEKEEIWHWFDERYSKGVYALLYGEENK